MVAILWYVRALIALLVVQFYAAGAALFGATGFQAHALIGWSVIILALGLLILILLAGTTGKKGSLGVPAALTLTLAGAQPVLVFWARPNAPVVAALHPVVGLAMLALLVLLERRVARRTPGHGMVDALARSPRRST